MKRWFVSKTESESLLEEVREKISSEIKVRSSSQFEFIEPEQGYLFARIEDYIFIQKDFLIPFLGSQKAIMLLPSVTVDKGAIKFLLNGADVMRPGIISYDEWGEKERILAVREELKGRAIVVGKALVSSKDMSIISKGACIKNIHHVGDKYWNLYKLV